MNTQKIADLCAKIFVKGVCICFLLGMIIPPTIVFVAEQYPGLDFLLAAAKPCRLTLARTRRTLHAPF